MKTKFLIVAVAALVLFSFTAISTKSSVQKNKTTQERGFALQDKDQF
jgi:hypothetical protein